MRFRPLPGTPPLQGRAMHVAQSAGAALVPRITMRMQLRYLQTLTDIASERSSTIVFPATSSDRCWTSESDVSTEPARPPPVAQGQQSSSSTYATEFRMHGPISNARLLDFRAALWLLVGLLSVGAARAQSADTVQAHWQLQGIKFTYTGFTTAYACDSLERKVREILVTLGAHPGTKVSAVGCVGPQPTRTAFVRIATATPEQMNQAQDTRRVDDEPAQNRAQLLDRMQLDEDFGSRSFAAHWRTFELSENRKLDLAPGDCELMAQLRDQVLPELGVRIMQESISCVPHQVSITTPTLQVSALVPAGPGQSG